MENQLFFRCPTVLTHYSPIVKPLNTGTPKNTNFPFGIHGISMVLSVPILKHFTVFKKSWNPLIDKKYCIYSAIRRGFPLSRMTAEN